MWISIDVSSFQLKNDTVAEIFHFRFRFVTYLLSYTFLLFGILLITLFCYVLYVNLVI